MKEVIVRYADNGYNNAVGEIVGELVRCGECRNFIDDKSVFADGLCKLHLNRHKNKDDYCSKGIRMSKMEE